MRVVFFGTPDFATPFLQALLDSPQIEVAGVVAQPDAQIGRKKIMTAPPVAALAKQHGIKLWQPAKVKKNAEFIAELAEVKADAFIVVAYGHILPQEILDIPRLGIVNVHPSDLPRWRGPAPLQATILHGDHKTAISIMKIDSGMDSGPILAKLELVLSANETTASLTERVLQAGPSLLVNTLLAYADGNIEPQAQSGEATYCSMLSRESGFIKPNHSAVDIDRMLRALTPWPGLTLKTEAGSLKILDIRKTQAAASPSNTNLLTVHEGKLLIETADGFIEILKLQVPGGNPISGQDYINGHPLLLNRPQPLIA